MDVDLVLRARRVVHGGGVAPASVHVARGRILRVDGYDAYPRGARLEEVPDDAVLLPGIVDTHVHINDPGRADWEGFETATRAAAAGGVTTVLDMPLNSIPPTTTLAGLEAKAEAARGRSWVDVAFAGGVVPGNTGELARLRAAGARAFKCFLVDSGVPEFGHVGEEELRAAMRELARLGAPLLVHAELAGPIDAALRAAPADADARRYATWLESRPKEAENQAVDMVVRLARETGARAHIVHLSSADALVALRRAREAGADVTAETCPHYLVFTSEAIEEGATAFKCAPPIREPANRERLWGGLRDGTIQQVVTDHSPSSPSLKCVDSGDFVRAWGGIASLQLGLAAVWTEARARGAALADVARWMCEGPAALVGLEGSKGKIAPGFDADLVVWKPDAEFRVDAARLEHRHKLTPYHGRQLFGEVVATFLRGKRIFLGGELDGDASGKWVR